MKENNKTKYLAMLSLAVPCPEKQRLLFLSPPTMSVGHSIQQNRLNSCVLVVNS